MNNNYPLMLEGYAKGVNDALRECLKTEDGLPQGIVVEAMRYSLLDSGKRLRAALTLEFARLCSMANSSEANAALGNDAVASGDSAAMPLAFADCAMPLAFADCAMPLAFADCAMPLAFADSAMALACSIEMVHAYSLIHDDLPCMDNDDFRRGKPSCHKAFGEANALLAGDALLTLAFETAASGRGLSPAQRLAAVSEIASSAGFRGMIGGQVIDLESEGKALPISGLDRLNSLKTGALLRSAARLGCIAGGADERIFLAADRFSAAYGLAFQITDDILDVTGDSATLGKPVGSDRDSEKNTYAALLGVDGAKEAAERLVNEAKKAAGEIPGSEFLCWLADMTLTREK